MVTNEDARTGFMREVIRVALDNANGRGGPFGAIVVKHGEVIARAGNRVTGENDPTAHAEIVAIREACRILGDFQLSDCEIYASSEPCPMCLSAIYWARLERIYYAASWADAAGVGFDDQLIFDEIVRPAGDRAIPAVQLLREEALAPFQAWARNSDRIEY